MKTEFKKGYMTIGSAIVISALFNPTSASAANFTLNSGNSNSGTFAYDGTIDTVNITTTGVYTIDAFGARGGNSRYGSTVESGGGLGGEIKGNFNLIAGEVLKILVGGVGSNGGGYDPNNYRVDGGAGGAGGTFVVSNTNKPLVIAGGGGGAGLGLGGSGGGGGGFSSSGSNGVGALGAGLDVTRIYTGGNGGGSFISGNGFGGTGNSSYASSGGSGGFGGGGAGGSGGYYGRFGPTDTGSYGGGGGGGGGYIGGTGGIGFGPYSFDPVTGFKVDLNFPGGVGGNAGSSSLTAGGNGGVGTGNLPGGGGSGGYDPTRLAAISNLTSTNAIHSGNGSLSITFVPAGSTAAPEPFTIVGTLMGGAAAYRMRKRYKAKNKM
jgi:hypothetical protein